MRHNTVGNGGASRLPLLSRGKAMTLIAVGDSIAKTGATQDINSQLSFIVIANVIRNSSFALINQGVSSDTTTLTLARFSDVMAQDGDVVFYCGTNDPGQAITAATTISNIASMATTAIRGGRRFIFCTIMPTGVNDDETPAGSARRVHQNAVNDWARQYALTTSGFYIADTEPTITDPATGIPLAGYTGDTVHPNVLGVMYPARALAATLEEIYQLRDTGAWNYADPKNLIGSNISAGNTDNADTVNGFSLTTGVTGTGASGWQCYRRNADASAVSVAAIARTVPGWVRSPYGRLVTTVTADGGGCGYYIGGSDLTTAGRWDSSWSAATAVTFGDKRKAATDWVHLGLYDGYEYICHAPGTTAGVEPTWADHQVEGEIWTDGTVKWLTVRKPKAGEELVGECELQLSSLTGAAVVRVSLVIQQGGDQVSSTAVTYDISGGPGAFHDWVPDNCKLRTPPLAVPVHASTLRYIFLSAVTYGLNGAVLTMEVTRAKVYNLTDIER